MQSNTPSDLDRPPFVTFEEVAVEDRDASIKNGFYTTRDVTFIKLIPHGSNGKQGVHEPYEDWLKRIKAAPLAAQYAPGQQMGETPTTASRFPRVWLDDIEKGYKAYKSGYEIPPEGDPILNWPMINVSMRKHIVEVAHIRTIQELAAASDEALTAIGMGAFNLRQRARDYIQAKESDAAKVAMTLENAAARTASVEQRNAELEAANAALAAKVNELLQAQAAAAAAPITPPPANRVPPPVRTSVSK